MTFTETEGQILNVLAAAPRPLLAWQIRGRLRLGIQALSQLLKGLHRRGAVVRGRESLDSPALLWALPEDACLLPYLDDGSIGPGSETQTFFSAPPYTCHLAADAA